MIMKMILAPCESEDISRCKVYVLDEKMNIINKDYYEGLTSPGSLSLTWA